MQGYVSKFLNHHKKKQKIPAQFCLCINTLPTQNVNLESNLEFTNFI